MQKVKRKDLRLKLSTKGYYNEFNPSETDKEATSFKLSNFLFPMFLFSIASVVYFLVVDSANHWISFIAYFAIFIAGLSFSSVLASRYRWMDIGKLLILLAFVFTFAVGAIFNYINYGAWETSELKSQLGSDKSKMIRVPISGTGYQGATYVKSRKIDPYHIQYYSFRIASKEYEGRYTSDTQEYALGDSIDIYYLLSDPRINMAVED